MNKYLWGLMTLLALGVAGYALSLLFFADLENHSFLAHHFKTHAWALYGHLGLGSGALVVGALQFLKQIRIKRPAIHRWIGRLYVIFCITSGFSGLALALSSEQTAASFGFIALAAFWIVTTSLGFLKAYSRDFIHHREWMIRSYALTYAAVALRFILPVELMLGIEFSTAYIIVSWACWVPNLIAAEWIIKHTPHPKPTAVQKNETVQKL